MGSHKKIVTIRYGNILQSSYIYLKTFYLDKGGLGI